jgi:hypothetical protein
MLRAFLHWHLWQWFVLVSAVAVASLSLPRTAECVRAAVEAWHLWRGAR